MSALYLFDIAAVCVLLIIMIFSCLTLKWKNNLNKAFMAIMVSVIIYSMLTGVCNFLVTRNNFSINLVFSLKSISAVFFSFISAGFILYAYIDISRTTKLSKINLLFVFLCFVWNGVWLIINDYTHCCFKVDSTGLVYGKLYFVLFFGFIAAMVYFPIMELKFHKTLYGTSVRMSMTYAFLSLAFGIATITAQYCLEKTVFFTSFFLAIQMVIAFIQMLIDRYSVDPSTELYLKNQCIKDINHSKDSSLFMIELVGYQQYDATIIDQVICDIRKYLESRIVNFTLYRVSTNHLIMKSQKNDDIKLLHIIQKYSINGIKLGIDSIAIRIKTALLPNNSSMSSEESLAMLEQLLNEIVDTDEACIILTEELKNKFISHATNVKNIINAIDNGGAVPFYQGIYSVNDNKITLCEALARLKINDEVLSPASFLSVLETNHCINKLDRSILISVLKELKKQKDNDPDFDIEAVSINLTADDIINREFINDVKVLIKENEIDPQMICFEICESTVISSFDKVRSVMNDLNELGIRFFLDDFGTGFSNIQAVLKLPFYLIKIDKSILDAAKDSIQNIDVLNGFIKALNSIGVKTLVEGVENENDLNIVKNAGADFIQGYYFHKPSEMDNLKETVK